MTDWIKDAHNCTLAGAGFEFKIENCKISLGDDLAVEQAIIRFERYNFPE